MTTVGESSYSWNSVHMQWKVKQCHNSDDTGMSLKDVWKQPVTRQRRSVGKLFQMFAPATGKALLLFLLLMFWLKWHYHCRNITAALYSKLQNTKTPTVAGLVTKGRLEQNSLQAAAERHQRRCISDGRRKAVPCTSRSHWEGPIAERWVISR